MTPNRASLSLKCRPEIVKTLILLCPATFGKARRQQFPNYPCLTNLVLVAEIASRKRLETIDRDRKAAMESLFVGY